MPGLRTSLLDLRGCLPGVRQAVCRQVNGAAATIAGATTCAPEHSHAADTLSLPIPLSLPGATGLEPRGRGRPQSVHSGRGADVQGQSPGGNSVAALYPD